MHENEMSLLKFDMYKPRQTLSDHLVEDIVKERKWF